MKYDVYQGLFIWPQKKTLNLHLTYFVETLYSASPQTNKKALIPLGIRAFPNFAFLRSGAYGTRTRDPMRDRHVFSPTELTHQISFFLYCISLDCGCKGTQNFDICKHFTNIFLNFFTSTLIISHLRYKKNKNTKKREHFMYFLNIICILVV